MAQRRMFSLSVVNTDAFLDMPTSAQALFFHLGMHGDDDGFVSSPKMVMRAAGCNVDDLKLLVAKGFVIAFPSGVIVIRDWKIMNTFKSDRYKETLCMAEKAELFTDERGVYCLGSPSEPDRKQDGSELVPQLNVTQINLSEANVTKQILCGTPETAAPPAASLILNDGSLFDVSEDQVERWKELYPAVDIRQELNNMTGWLEANPTQRKTRRGIMRFCNAWLAREQDKPAKDKQRRQMPPGNHTDFLDLV